MFNFKLKFIFLLLTIALAACSSGNSTSKSETSETVPQIEPVVDPVAANWKNILGTTSTPPGWSAIPCDDNQTNLCVRANDKQIARIELSTRSVQNLPDFQEMLVKEGIPITTTEYHNPKYIDKVLLVLKEWVVDHYDIIAEDRQLSSGDGVTISSQEPKEALVGSLRSLHYDLAILKQKSLQERFFGYIVLHKTNLYVIQATVEPRIKILNDPGSFTKEEEFQLFQPHLEKIVANLKIADSK